MTREMLISDAHLREQQILHAAPRGYGQRGAKWAATVLELAREYRCATALDYGCGRGSLAVALHGCMVVREYDPAVFGKASLPDPADLVVCTDVLEHVESDRIFAVVGHLAALTRRILFVVVSLVPTDKRLSDGRQAHILLRSVEWWRYLLVEGHDFILARELQAGPAAKQHKQWVAVLKR